MQSNKNKLKNAIESHQQGKIDKASKLFKEVLKSDPKSAVALYSLSLLALNSGNHAEALRYSGLGVKAAPFFAPLRLVHGATLQATYRYEEALQSYEMALKINPDYVEALSNSGVLLRNMFRHLEAVQKFNQILTLDPNNTLALANCGILLSEFKKNEQSIALFKRLISINPDYEYALGLLVFQQLHICDWTNFELLTRKITEGVLAGRRVCKSLAFMSISDSALAQMQCAKIFAQHFCPKNPISYWQGEQYAHKKIRLAYISPDLREHPVCHLIAGVIERHDKARFETIAISLGIDDGSRLRARMLKAFDCFIDAKNMGASQIAKLMRDMEVDIAVDLSGYTADSRVDIFAYRPAPLQVNFLGYSGTMGADFMDYIIADRHVIPEQDRQYFTEKVVYLPDAFLPTDKSIKISERTPSRAECGLPETGFVFCSFNHDYKISPPIFEIWMRLLHKVPGSVLWLMSRNETAQHNLRQSAERLGIEPSRLVFAQRVTLVEDHLARYRQADLFLDTHPYNAHTTSADALMAGLPVVTYTGGAFPARVAGSLLHAVGLSELVTHSVAEYEELILALANTPNRLLGLREKLAANINTQPLFNTDLYCRNLEAAYLEMYDRSTKKLAPAHFAVETSDPVDSLAVSPVRNAGVGSSADKTNQLCACRSGLLFENCHGDINWIRLLAYLLPSIPENKAMLTMALESAKRGNIPMADLLVRSHLAQHKDDIDALVLLAEIAVKLKVFSVASRCYEKVLSSKQQAGCSYEEMISVQSTLAQIKSYQQAKSLDTAGCDDKFLLIKAWGYGFWSEIDHVIGQLLVAEMTNRIPIVHWGSNCLFKDVSSENAFDLYFQPVSAFTIADIKSDNFSYYPSKWHPGNLNQEDHQKWHGVTGRQSGILLLGRDEDVVVSDFYTQVIQLMPWTNEESIFAEKNWYEVYAYFFEKYIKLKASLVEAIDQYYQENMAGYQWLAVHMRGSDKINEQADLNLLNQECHKLVQSYIEQNSALRIFLLTDSSLYLEEFKEKYGGKILYIEAKRSDSDQGVHNSGFSGKEVGESVIMDCYLAARCDFFIGNGGSNVSAAIGSLKSWPAGSYMLLGRDLRSNLSKMLYNW